MFIADIIRALEEFAPPVLQEEYDNAGLITGERQWPCRGAIICLDSTEAVVDEAIAKNCNLIIAHHPVIFRGLKQLTGKNQVERTVIRAIRNDIAIYATHTNLDNVRDGVNGELARRLGLTNCRVLQPKAGLLRKLQVFVPRAQAAAVRTAVFAAGGGSIGDYSDCSFNSEGEGTFTPGPGTHPFSGSPGQPQSEPEIKIELIFPAWLESRVVRAMLEANPYEEVAYDILSLNNPFQGVGAGIVGELAEAVSETDFLRRLQSVTGIPAIRHSPLTGVGIRRIAICGGAGSFLIANALREGADMFVTSDTKYHDFFEADGQLVLADIGHFESEQFTIDLLATLLREKFPTFAALKTGVNTNPVNYFLQTGK
jgi:dinuclear metal center YbgI/SA1388 family protein